MSNKDLKNLQNSLYNSILPPPPKAQNTLVARVLRGLGLI